MNRFTLALVAASSALVLTAPHHARAQASVAAACSAQSIPVGFGNAYPTILQNGDLCVGASTPSGTPTTIKPDSAISTGDQQVTSLSAAASFTPPALTTFCVLIPEAAALRFRADGTSPTASVGTPMAVGQPFTFRMSIANLTALKFIQQTSGGILNISCFKDT